MTHYRFLDESSNKDDLKDAEIDLRMEKLVAEVNAIVDVSDNQGKTYASFYIMAIFSNRFCKSKSIHWKLKNMNDIFYLIKVLHLI